MKRGEPTIYSLESLIPSSSQHQVNLNKSNNYQSRKYGNARINSNLYSQSAGTKFISGCNGNQLKFKYFNRTINTDSVDVSTGESFCVTLQVGNRTFTGMGPTQQSAR